MGRVSTGRTTLFGPTSVLLELHWSLLESLEFNAVRRRQGVLRTLGPILPSGTGGSGLKSKFCSGTALIYVHQNKKEPDTKCPGGSSYLVGLSVFLLVIIGSWSSFSPSRDPSKYEAGCAFWPHERWQCKCSLLYQAVVPQAVSGRLTFGEVERT